MESGDYIHYQHVQLMHQQQQAELYGQPPSQTYGTVGVSGEQLRTVALGHVTTGATTLITSFSLIADMQY